MLIKLPSLTATVNTATECDRIVVSSRHFCSCSCAMEYKYDLFRLVTPKVSNGGANEPAKVQ